MKISPYSALGDAAFWRTAIAEVDPLKIEGVYKKKWAIDPAQRIGSAGSCFAQHVTRHLRAGGFNVVDFEPPPVGLSKELHQQFGFSMYSARYGNVYTVRQMLQLVREAKGDFQPGAAVWERNGRFYDALRPSVEPYGLDSEAEVLAHRQQHLAKVRRLLENVEVFVFTLGLTEAWLHRDSGTVYPSAPGAIAGRYDPSAFVLNNSRVNEIVDDFNYLRDEWRTFRPDGLPPRFLLTVSPVPLTATATGRHVLSATTYSKAALRTAAEYLSDDNDDIDYFPSYEIITNPAARSTFFENNLRSVSPVGVDTVMRIFMTSHGSSVTLPSASSNPPFSSRSDEVVDELDVQCEEAMLETLKGGDS